MKPYKTRFNFLFVDPQSKASVISLDYSNCGGYLSSVYENGIINIYGLTTKIKSDTITLDKDSSLARFHPAKRFHLAVASYKGAATVYDIASKKIHFQQKDAHDAPCRDLAMAEDTPDRLFTCGCDSFIKIFDTRKKSTGLMIQSSCGLSTISVSKCGGFFAVGNLKGDVLTYDMRALRHPLDRKKVDNELITRIAFVPTSCDGVEQFPTMSNRESSGSVMSDDLPDPPEMKDDYTMDDIVGFQKGRVSDFEMSCASRVSTISCRADHDGRISDAFGRNVANALRDLSFGSETSFVECNPTTPEIDDRNINVDRLKRFSGGKKDSLAKRRSSYMPSPLQLIREEIVDKENHSGSLNAAGSPSLSPSVSGPRFSSTPQAPFMKLKKNSHLEIPVESTNDEIIDVDAIDASEQENTEVLKQPSSAATIVPSQFNFDIKKEFEALHEKIHFEVQSLNFDLNGRHIEMMSYIHNQRRQLQSRIQMIEECMATLMNDDVKINRIMELQDENQELREQLDNIMRRLNS